MEGAAAAAAAQQQAAVRQRRRKVVSAAARGLTARAATTLTVFVALPDKSKGRLAIAALANLLDGGIQLILGEMLGGATDGRALDRTLHIFLFVAVFLSSGALPIIATVHPAVGGQAAILVAAAIGVAGIATFASKAEAKAAGVHVIILCGLVLYLKYTINTKMVA